MLGASDWVPRLRLLTIEYFLHTFQSFTDAFLVPLGQGPLIGLPPATFHLRRRFDARVHNCTDEQV